MLSEVNKVNKDNPIFVSFLLYFVPTPPLILTPPFINFSKSLKPPPFILTPPPFIMNLRVGYPPPDEIFKMAARFATVTEEEIRQMNEEATPAKRKSTCLVNTKTTIPLSVGA